jgi:glycosyltransferase involved in cell wall biosynthesis
MIKVGFIHDHFFHIDDNGDAYSPGKLNANSFDRYLEHFNLLTIVSRFKVNQTISTFHNKITSSKVNFIGFENQSTFLNRFVFRKIYKKKLTTIINDLDGLIIRVPSEIGFLAAEIAYEHRIPYICEVVACPVDAMDGNSNVKSTLYKNIIKSAMKDSVARADGCLYVTDSFLQERYPNYGFNVSASNVEIDIITAPKVHLAKSVYRITLVGNLDSHHKGYELLYKTLEEMDKKLNFNIEVILVGLGTLYKQDLNFENINVNFIGGLTKNEVFSILDGSDLYIQPSNQEGLPRATIEAMSRGLPCVVSDAGGLPELINANLVHCKNDHMNLAKLIMEILTSPKIYNVAARENTKMVKKFLSTELKVKRFHFYNQLKNRL